MRTITKRSIQAEERIRVLIDHFPAAQLSAVSIDGQRFRINDFRVHDGEWLAKRFGVLSGRIEWVYIKAVRIDSLGE